MDLPKNEKTFNFEAVGDLTGKKYEGTFTVKCVLTIGDRRRLELEKSRQLGDMKNPTQDLIAIAIMSSNLLIRVIDGPDWWKQLLGEDLIDQEILPALYSKVLDQEDAWRKELKEKASQGN